MKLWQQTRKHLAAFPGRTRFIDDRPYLSFEDYLKWRSRRCKGDLKSGMGSGVIVTRWNQWVEGQCGEDKAVLAGIEVGKLDCYAGAYRYRVCLDATELAEEVSLRKSTLESSQLGKPSEDRIRQGVEHWKALVLSCHPEIYTMRGAIDSINRRYLEDQEVLVPAEAEGFDQLVALVEKLVGNFNEDLAGSIEGVEKLQDEVERRSSPLLIDLAGLNENVQEAVNEQVAYMVDMAKADALEVLGETKQALELVDRHV